jgi:hypothetical protein
VSISHYAGAWLARARAGESHGLVEGQEQSRKVMPMLRFACDCTTTMAPLLCYMLV